MYNPTASLKLTQIRLIACVSGGSVFGFGSLRDCSWFLFPGKMAMQSIPPLPSTEFGVTYQTALCHDTEGHSVNEHRTESLECRDKVVAKLY